MTLRVMRLSTKILFYVVWSQAQGRPCMARDNWLRLAAGPVDRRTKKAAGLALKLPVLWQWTGRYFEH